MIRADEIETKRAALAAFFASGSGRTISAVLTVAVALRYTAAMAGSPPSWPDLVVMGVTVASVGVVEWVIHLYVLHAPAESWMSRRLGTGAGHREHHLDPAELRWLLLAGTDAGVFAVLIALGIAAWTIPLAALSSSSIAGTFLTGLVMAFAALWHYEWTHLLMHTRYRPHTRYYTRLARNHRLHHYRNEGYWLGVTTNAGDRLFGTYPADKGDVPLSDTAHALEPDR